MLRMKESAGGPANGDPVSWECLPHRPTQRDIASSAEGPTLPQPCRCPFPHALRPSCPQPCSSLCPPAQSPSAPCHLCHPRHPLAPASFPPRFHHLLLFEPAVALGLWFAWRCYSPSPCTHHIKSIPGLDWVGPRWAVVMFYFGLGPAGGNTNLLDTSTPSRSIDPPAPTHDNSPSR